VFFLVEHAVGMHASREAGVVLEHHLYGVSYLGPDQRPQGAKVVLDFGALLEFSETIVCVLAVEGLAVDLADAVLPLADEDVFVLVEGLAADLAHPSRGVVPVDGVRCYVVGAGLAASLRPFASASYRQ